MCKKMTVKIKNRTNKLYIDTTHCFERGSFDTIEKKYFTVNPIILFFNLQNQNCERTLYSLFLFPNSLYVYKMAPKQSQQIGT